MEEDWAILCSFLPENWAELAVETGALKGLRKHKTAEAYLRTLLIHIGCGHSLRDAATRATLAGLGDISDVALLKRLRKAKDWLHGLCVSLFEEQGLCGSDGDGFDVRLFDATNVREVGPTGSLWRIHYSVQLPSLTCDYFKLTPTKGKGTGESFFQYPIRTGDHIIADRGYSTAPGIHHVASKKADVIVRVNTSTLPLWNLEGKPFSLLEKVNTIQQAGAVDSWDVLVPKHKELTVRGRICAIRKSNEAIRVAHERIRKTARRKGTLTKPETLEYAKYVIVFTTFPASNFSASSILEWYRIRWQVELVFKRFKSIAGLGHLPKHSDDSSKAWLYGKLMVALLTTKLINHATSISPWGYTLEGQSAAKRLAGI